MSFVNYFSKIFVILLVSARGLVNCYDCKANSAGSFVRLPCIVGGYRPVNWSLAKYVVSIRRQEESEHRFGYTHFCAGSIIAKNKILTAAHCFYRKRKNIPPHAYKVVAKTPNRLNKSAKTLELNVEHVVLHPDYTHDTIFNDIALLILSVEIILEPQWADIIPLVKRSIKPGTLCQVIGWGKLYQHGPLANEILHVNLNLHSRNYCRKLYPHFSGKKLCASSKDDKERDACNGDSGGPMICEGVLTGIVSYGYGCAAGHAGIYTNVLKYLDWINNNGNTFRKPFIFLNIPNILLVLLF